MKLKLFLYAFAAMSLFCALANGQSIAITNARIVTVSGATIEKGTVVVRDGLIQAVGADTRTPADAQVIDATGLTVYPGFIDSLSSAGLQARTTPTAGGGPGGGGQQAAQQAAAQAQPSNSNYVVGIRPEVSAVDELRAGESQFDAIRNAGFTSAVTVGRTGIFNGRSAIINLAGDSVSAMLVKEPYAEHISFATVSGYPGSLLGTFSALRQMLLDAKRLQDWQKAYAASPKGMTRPEDDKSLEALIPLLNREMPVVFNANTEREIIRALDLSKEFNLKAIIAGGQESAKVADRLKSQNVPVLLSLNFPKRTAAASPEADPENLSTLRFRAEVPKTAARLSQAGVKFAFQSGGLTAMTDFFANAGKSVENGLTKDAAIRAMTLSAAEILDISDRLGSIESGKIANLAVVKNDVFATDRFVPYIFVDGKLFEQKEPVRVPGGGRGPGGQRGGGANAAGAPVVAAPPNVANVAGTYNITIDVPGQTLTGTMVLTQQGDVITGTMTTQLGVTQIRGGKASTDGFAFAAAVEFGGATIDISVKATVSGNNLTGTIDSPQGTVTLTGTKVP
ncbi:MAG: amidohydrolase family protein [Pyrinomonadaceae bacterium]